MPHADSNGIAICYQVYGEDSAPPVLLVEGFGTQLIGWRPQLIARFVSAGLRIVALDNRDTGLSDRLGPSDSADPGYTIADMAGDVLAVADALRLEHFHIAGQSMGGLIAQSVLAQAPERVRSATFFYTSPAITPEYIHESSQEALTVQDVSDRDAAIEAAVARERFSASPGYPFDAVWARELAGKAFDRAPEPAGGARQVGAMLGFGEGVQEQLRSLHTPASIFHGTDDFYIRPGAAIALHGLLRNSELHVFPGMGHELPEPLWDDFAAGLRRAVRRGEEAATAR